MQEDPIEPQSDLVTKLASYVLDVRLAMLDLDRRVTALEIRKITQKEESKNGKN